jgi:hypothetical protein
MNTSPPQGNSWTPSTANSSTSDIMRSLLDQEFALRCRGLLATLSLFSSALGLVQGDDDVNVVIYEVMHNINTAILLLDDSLDASRPAPAQPPHMPRLAYETVRRMRETVLRTDALTPPTSADAADAADALSAKVFDDFVFDYLLLDVATASPSPTLPLLPPANRQSIEAVNQAEVSLSPEDRKTLAEIRRNRLDFSLMARRLGTSPDEGRMAFRHAASHLRDAYFHRTPSGTVAPMPPLLTTLDPASVQQLDAEELEQISREKALFRYIGALERHDHARVEAILIEAEADPALEEMLLVINTKLEAYLFSAHGLLSALGASMWSSHTFDERPEADLGLADADEVSAASRLDMEYSLASASPIKLPIPSPTGGEADARRVKIASLLWLSATHLVLEQTTEAVECLDDALGIALEIDDHVALATCAYWHAAFEYVVFLQYPDHLTMTQAYCYFGLKLADEASDKGIPFDLSLRERLAALEVASLGRASHDQSDDAIQPQLRKASVSSQLPRRWGNLFIF